MSETTAYTQEAHSPFSGRIFKSVEYSEKWLRKWAEGRKIYRQTVFELSFCSDRQLSDIGIARSDIRRIARQARDMAQEAQRV